MRRMMLLLALAVVAPHLDGQDGDPLFGRVQQLVNAGNRSAARAMADSALVVRTPGTMAYAEALYARAYATSDAGAAERDYVRVSIEYPFSPRAEEAILMVGQFRQSRGDREGARAQYERLAREFPRSSQAARANYWAGRLALEDGDLSKGCAFLLTASAQAPRGDIELRNQVEYLRARCMVPAMAAAPSRDSVRKDSFPSAPPAAVEPAPSTTEYSIQVAAYARKRDADALATRLRTRGFPVRVVGPRAPWRVRIGRYTTREAAAATQVRLRQSRVTGIIVPADPR